MNQKEIKELIDFLIERDISEFELERGDVKVRIKRGGDSSAPVVSAVPAFTPVPVAVTPSVAVPVPQAASPSAVPPAAGAPPAAATGEEEDLHVVKSPIVGTFYE